MVSGRTKIAIPLQDSRRRDKASAGLRYSDLLAL
jgi:hypothetical protein